MEKIQNYQILPLGRSKDLSGLISGDFTVLYKTNPPEGTKSKETFWLCQCNKCKKYIVKKATTVKKGFLCDCKYDLTGRIFGRWTVLYKTEKRTKNRIVIWHCRCECGNEKDVDAYTLTSGQSKSCGCLQKEIASEIGKRSRIDLTGQRFGKLVALYPIYSNQYNTHTKWHCKCDCGNECDVDMGNLRQGFSQSCGCTASKQEENIIKLLKQNNIQFEYQKRFINFKEKEFDFYVNNQYIIEYDGSQHFKYTGTGWDTKEHFERTRKSDLIKNKYCFERHIPLIRIPYNKEYTFEDLKLETTRFLLTPENEQEYYNQYQNEVIK